MSNKSKRQFVRPPWQVTPQRLEDEGPLQASPTSRPQGAPLPETGQGSQSHTEYPTQPPVGEDQAAGMFVTEASTQQMSAVPIANRLTEHVSIPLFSLPSIVDTPSQGLPSTHSTPRFPPFVDTAVQALPATHSTPRFPFPPTQNIGAPAPALPLAHNTPSFSMFQNMGVPAPVMATQMPVARNAPLLASRIAALPAFIREDVERYMEWLQRNNSLQTSVEALQAYQNESLEIKKIGKREVRIFAPFHLKTSALRVITPQQMLTLVLLAIVWGVGLLLLHLTMVAITLGTITLLYILGFITSGILATNSFKSSSGEKIDEDIIVALDQLGVEWPSYTILCPLYKETAVVPQFVEAMRSLNYPAEKLQVLFLTEENDKETRAALYAMDFPDNFVVLTVPQGNPQTKPRACNFGLLQAKGQFVVIFDAEDKPEPYQLKKAVLTFANQGPTVACVQAKLNFYNPNQNLLTRWFTAEYSTWFDILLPGLQRSGFSLPLGGTSNHFRTEVLRALGGWDAFNVTEDCDLGLRIAQYGLQTAVLDSTTYEEATSRYKTWIYQRSRWIKGYLQTYLVHMRNPMQMLQRGHLRKFLSLQIIVGVWSIVLLINPIMWALTIGYTIFHPVELYKLLFPGPVLYAGAFCLVFGNFFYIYVHVIGCLRRKEYALIKWVLLLPLYWIMMSISAYIAFYQLIVKPHYWEKTQHGNHLAAAQRTQARALRSDHGLEGRSVVSSMPTSRHMAIRVPLGGTGKLDTTTRRVSAIRKTLSTQLGQRDIQRTWAGFLSQELWLVAVIFMAAATSITVCWYLFQQHQLLLYSDGLSHMQIARMVFDSQTPGLAQLGGNWLPLPQILMWPFIWNDYLWQTGLAGSFGNMLSYVVASTYLFLLLRYLTKRNGVALIGTLFFVFNPNILYFQATPLSDELISIASGMAGLYYFLRWVKEDKVKYLIFSAAGVCLGTLARYDGWPLFVALLCLVVVNGLFRKQKWKQIQGNVLVFALLGGLGMLLWLAWDKMLFGDPLYFQHGPFSAQAQQLVYFHRGQLESYHDLVKSIKVYFSLTIDTVGLAPVIILGVSVLTFVVWGLFAFFKKKDRSALVVVMIIGVLLIPFAFYVESLYSGQAIIWIPGATPPTAPSQLFNTRYGIQTVAPVAVFLAILVHNVLRLLKGRMLIVGYILCALLVLAQAGYTSSTGIISFETGLYGTDCMPTTELDIYMAQHYNGGNVLMDLANPSLNDTEDGIDMKNVIYEGSGTIWAQALRNPVSTADWVVAGPGDLITANIKLSYPPFSQQFELVAQYKHLRLYHKRGLPPLPTKTLSPYFLSEHSTCTNSKG